MNFLLEVKKKAYFGLLIVASYAPFASVAMAAESKLTNLEGELQQDKLRAQLQATRNALLPFGVSRMSLSESKKRFLLMNPSMSGLEAENAFVRAVLMLKESGLLFIDERNVLSGPPSDHAPH